MKNKMKLLAMLLFGAMTLQSCDSSGNGEESERIATAETEETAIVQAPAFNADSAYYFIERQVAFGPRVPNTPEHYKTGEWLIEMLRSYGAEVQVQAFQARAFDGTMLNLRNIIGTINPNATKRVLLAAHWDTRPFADKDDTNQNKPIDGANDGASGVGVLLEIARTIQAAEQKPGIGIDIIFFDGEDYGRPDNSEHAYMQDDWCLGSQYWSKNKHKPNYKANFGILLDMVGAENAKFAREGTSMQYARNIVDKVWRAGNKLGYSDYFKYVNAPAITDDHYYVNTVAGIRMIDIIEYNMADPDDYFGPYHHRHTDTMDIISTNTLKAVGQTVLHVLYNE
jgi:glutaminyl-peptide cyclotransferase